MIMETEAAEEIVHLFLLSTIPLTGAVSWRRHESDDGSHDIQCCSASCSTTHAIHFARTGAGCSALFWKRSSSWQQEGLAPLHSTAWGFLNPQSQSVKKEEEEEEEEEEEVVEEEKKTPRDFVLIKRNVMEAQEWDGEDHSVCASSGGDGGNDDDDDDDDDDDVTPRTRQGAEHGRPPALSRITLVILVDWRRLWQEP